MGSIRLAPSEVAAEAEKTPRCVHCARPKAMHTGDDFSCPKAYKTKFGTMDLPDGKTCGDCAHTPRCLALGYTENADMTRCDFFPVRFMAKAEGR